MKNLNWRLGENKIFDSDVVCIETVGELLGLDADTDFFGYFQRHFADGFSAHKARSPHDFRAVSVGEPAARQRAAPAGIKLRAILQAAPPEERNVC